jgi:CheY-like chemotaxis protein
MEVPRRFIIVDDDPISNLISTQVIQGQFPLADVRSFTDPSLALESMVNEYGTSEFVEPIVLLVDLNMPLMTGWEFIESFKMFNTRIQRHFSVFILTSSIDERDKRRAALDPIIQGFISKPLSKKDILKHLNSSHNLKAD